MQIKANHADALYQATLNGILTGGSYAAPRGKSTIETVGAHLILDSPYHNIITLRRRELNYHFMVAEWLWMMLGMNDDAMIAPYNKAISQFSDDGETFRGAYGPKLIEQLPYVIDLLRTDPSSRQAVITIWRERPQASKDIPCTIMFQFLLRFGPAQLGVRPQLDMLTYMRSNDAWLGLPYDLFNFTMLQQYVAAKLNAICGSYHHMVGSLHVYEKDMPKLDAVISEPETGLRDSLIGLALLPPMPREFRATYMGLTLMGPGAQAKDEMLDWMSALSAMPSPWEEILQLLGHRFHKRHDMLLAPWNTLVP